MLYVSQSLRARMKPELRKALEAELDRLSARVEAIRLLLETSEKAPTGLLQNVLGPRNGRNLTAGSFDGRTRRSNRGRRGPTPSKLDKTDGSRGRNSFRALTFPLVRSDSGATPTVANSLTSSRPYDNYRAGPAVERNTSQTLRRHQNLSGKLSGEVTLYNGNFENKREQNSVIILSSRLSDSVTPFSNDSTIGSSISAKRNPPSAYSARSLRLRKSVWNSISKSTYSGSGSARIASNRLSQSS